MAVNTWRDLVQAAADVEAATEAFTAAKAAEMAAYRAWDRHINTFTCEDCRENGMACREQRRLWDTYDPLIYKRAAAQSAMDKAKAEFKAINQLLPF